MPGVSPTGRTSPPSVRCSWGWAWARTVHRTLERARATAAAGTSRDGGGQGPSDGRRATAGSNRSAWIQVWTTAGCRLTPRTRPARPSHLSPAVTGRFAAPLGQQPRGSPKTEAEADGGETEMRGWLWRGVAERLAPVRSPRLAASTPCQGGGLPLAAAGGVGLAALEHRFGALVTGRGRLVVGRVHGQAGVPRGQERPLNRGELAGREKAGPTVIPIVGVRGARGCGWCAW